MTREEAIKVLEMEKKFLFRGSLADKYYEPAFDMAIKALKAQERKCETCVSRRGMYCPKLQRTTSDTFFCAYWRE